MRSLFLLFVLFLCCFDNGDSWRRRRRRSPPPPPRVNGGWSAWGGYGGCSKTCGGGLMYRHRSCTNPTPRNGGAGCSGSSSHQANCNTQPCPVNGDWSAWGGYGGCSKTCGGGLMYRHRSCTNPTPRNGGAGCSGSSSHHANCNTQPCPVWSGWGPYGACGKSCGGGVRTRHRSCRNAVNGGGCPGASSDHVTCNTHKCSALPVGNAITFPDGGKFQLQGCFEDYSHHMKKLLLTERDYTHHAWNGKWLNWNEWNKHMTGIINRCAVKAKAKGYQTFGMAYYGECWVEKTLTDALTVYTENLRNTSKCTTEDFADCKTGSTKCIGREWGIAVYQLIQD